MLTPGYTTIEEIMETIHRDYEFDANRGEIAEWIWKCVGFLGIPYGMEEKIIDSSENELFKVTDFKCPLPVDLYMMKGIKHKDLDFALKKSTNLYAMNKVIEDSVTTSFEIVGTNIVENETEIEWSDTSFVVSNDEILTTEALTYIEKGNNIYFGFKNGDIVIVYDAFPVDNNGYPKVPNDAKYIRAVVLFCVKKIAFRLHLKGSLIKQLYDEIALQYSFAAGAAKTKALTPDVDLMEAIRQYQTRLNPLMGRHADGFAANSGTLYTNYNITNRTIS